MDTPATDDPKQALLDAVAALRTAEQLLLESSRTMSDPAELIQLNLEYSHIDSYLTQVIQALAATDDDDFDRTSGSLKTQATTLAADAQAIAKVVKNAQTAGKIVGCIAQAAAAVSKL